MKSKAASCTAQPNFFQPELTFLIKLRHPVANLSAQISLAEFEKQLQPTYVPIMGAPGINTRLMVSLHDLKFQYYLIDQDEVARRVENPCRRFLAGCSLSPTKPKSTPPA